MLIRLFDLQNNVIVPTEHCYTLKSLSRLMDEFPEDYLKMYQYLFYMACPDPKLNPFFHFPEYTKEETILSEIEAEFSPEEELLQEALEIVKELYTTPTMRAYKGIKTMLDNLASYMEKAKITDGRDGNITALVNTAAKFEAIRQSFKGALKDLQEEQASQVRGGQRLGYDQA